MQVLYDLVTVSREFMARVRGALRHWGDLGRWAIGVDLQARKPAGCWYGKNIPNHEVLIVLIWPCPVTILLPFYVKGSCFFRAFFSGSSGFKAAVGLRLDQDQKEEKT